MRKNRSVRFVFSVASVLAASSGRQVSCYTTAGGAFTAQHFRHRLDTLKAQSHGFVNLNVLIIIRSRVACMLSYFPNQPSGIPPIL